MELAGLFERRSGVLVILALLLGVSVTRLYNYLLFHSMVEVFSVAVSWAVFFLAWNSRQYLREHYILLLGISSLFVGTIDLFHALTYKGLAVVAAGSAEAATQFWIAGRYLQSLSLLVAVTFLRRKLNVPAAFAAYVVTAGASVMAILEGVFPACYVEGAGLTPFKVASEYMVIAMLLGALALLVRRRADFDGAVLAALAGYIAFTIAAEVSFTLYTNVYGLVNAIGHLLRFVAFCLLYRAIVFTGVRRPLDLVFRELARREEELRASDERYRVFVGGSAEGICRVELSEALDSGMPEEQQVRLLLERGFVAECNDAFARMHGRAGAKQMLGAELKSVLAGADPDAAELFGRFVRSGYRLPAAEVWQGSRCLALSYTGSVEGGRVVRMWGVQRDVTERRLAAAERERLIAELQQALAEVKRLGGLLPICANCKKIRDDKGYWTQVEQYLAERADVSFTHGICPECVQVLFPDFAGGGAQARPAASE